MKVETYCYRTKPGWNAAPNSSLDSENTMVLVFAAPSYKDNDEQLQWFVEQYPQSHVIGCSSAGEIFGKNLCDESLCVAVAQFESTRLASAVAGLEDSADSYVTGQRLSEQLSAKDLQAIFVLSDGLHVNGSELVKGIASGVPQGTTITGGLAGDSDSFGRTWTLFRETVADRQVVAVAFYGSQVGVGYGSEGGWDQFGIERSITKSEGNKLFELDGRPALALYKEYLGERAEGLPATGLLFPLSIRPDAQSSNSLVRTILAVSEEENSLTFAGDIPEGWRASLMSSAADRIIEGSAAAAAAAAEQLGSPALSVLISCVGRRLVLGEMTEDELEAALQAPTSGSQQVGFYSYGEITPNSVGSCELQNQTMTITTFWEKS